MASTGETEKNSPQNTSQPSGYGTQLQISSPKQAERGVEAGFPSGWVTALITELKVDTEAISSSTSC